MALRRRLIWVILLPSLAALLTGGFILLGLLANEVVRKIRVLETARSDNVQWTLSQAEVEFLELAQALYEARRTTPPDLSALRQEYDVFYSRIQTISRGRLYATLARDPRYAAAIADFQTFLETSVTLIDGPDAALVAGLGPLSRDLDSLRPRMREISLVGLEAFAAEADALRAQVSGTMTRLGLTTGALLTGLGIAAIILWSLYRVSERRAGALQRATVQLNTMIETSLDAIVVANLQGHIVAFNAAAETIFDRRRADVIGRDMGDMIIPEPYRAAHAAGMKRYAETRERRVIGAGRLRLDAMKADGTVFPVELAIQSAILDDGEVFVSFLRDISHRVAAEQELIKARDRAVAGERAKSSFLAVMSHELRTPLNGVLGTLALLRDTDLDSRQDRLVRNMEASGALLLSHANDVLDISKFEAGKLDLNIRPTDLDTLVEDVLAGQRDLAYGAQNRLETYWTGRAPGRVLTDPERVKQILVNLVGNAIKFTRSGRVTVEKIDLGPDPDRDAGRVIEIRVHDTGIGIAPEDMDRVFEDFETGDPSYGRIAEGTGLGLGIARRLATALGGEIGASSQPAVGSTFWLRLAVALAPDDGPVDGDRPAAEAASADRIPAMRVLVVEDNAINREVISGMLRADGHSVVEAHDGREGIALAERQVFDIILMDLRMPHVDGFEATRRIRASEGLSRATPIFAVTAQALSEDMDRDDLQVFTGWISKPIDRRTLRRTLETISRTRLPERLDLEGRPRPGDPQDGPDAAPPPAVDRAILSEMVEIIGPEAAGRLLDRFVGEIDRFVLDTTAVDRGAPFPPDLAERAHKHAGSAGTFGCLALRKILNQVEEAILATEDPATVDSLLASFRTTWETTREDLRGIAASGIAAPDRGPAAIERE